MRHVVFVASLMLCGLNSLAAQSLNSPTSWSAFLASQRVSRVELEKLNWPAIESLVQTLRMVAEHSLETEKWYYRALFFVPAKERIAEMLIERAVKETEKLVSLPESVPYASAGLGAEIKEALGSPAGRLIGQVDEKLLQESLYDPQFASLRKMAFYMPRLLALSLTPLQLVALKATLLKAAAAYPASRAKQCEAVMGDASFDEKGLRYVILSLWSHRSLSAYEQLAPHLKAF